MGSARGCGSVVFRIEAEVSWIERRASQQRLGDFRFDLFIGPDAKVGGHPEDEAGRVVSAQPTGIVRELADGRQASALMRLQSYR